MSDPVFDEEELVSYIKQKSSIDEKDIRQVLRLEVEYMEKIGLVSSEKPSFWKRFLNLFTPVPELNEEDLIESIKQKSTIDEQIIRNVLKLEFEYMETVIKPLGNK